MSHHNFLTGLTSGFTPVVDAGFSLKEYRHVDLSVNNLELTQAHLDIPEGFQEYLDSFLRKQGGKVAYGGYNEHRGLYRRSDLFSCAEEEENIRNRHIGIDIWAPKSTSVLAVLNGKIHSFRDNDNFGDYGPTIILEHEAEGEKFFTLYGHLERTSLAGLEVGQEVEQGEKIAALGDALENGNYAPHLHFQIILDLQGKVGDYPGVSSAKELDFYLDNCPDPNLLLKIQ